MKVIRVCEKKDRRELKDIFTRCLTSPVQLIEVKSNEAEEIALRVQPEIAVIECKINSDVFNLVYSLRTNDNDIKILILAEQPIDSNIININFIKLEVEGILIEPYEEIELITLISSATRNRKIIEGYRKTEIELKILTDNMLDLITLTDKNGIFQYFSPSNTRVLGYKSQEMLGRSAFDFVHPEDVTRIIAEFQKGLESKKDGSGEFRFKKADGTYIWVEILGKVMLDSGGYVSAIIFASRDIADRKKKEEELQKELYEIKEKIRNSNQS
jgi:PAS domain S-box-containing protein